MTVTLSQAAYWVASGIHPHSLCLSSLSLGLAHMFDYIPNARWCPKNYLSTFNRHSSFLG